MGETAGQGLDHLALRGPIHRQISRSFNMEMHHYDVVPGQQQEKIIEKAKAERGEVKEEEE